MAGLVIRPFLFSPFRTRNDGFSQSGLATLAPPPNHSGATSYPIIAIAVACIFLAAIVHGYSGISYSLLSITSLFLVLSPAEVLSSIFMLEVVASLRLLPEIWRHVHWRSLTPLLTGFLVATPVGVFLLAHVPAPPMQVALGLSVRLSTLFLWLSFELKTMPGTQESTAVGAASGLANGAFGIGGPPAVLF